MMNIEYNQSQEQETHYIIQGFDRATTRPIIIDRVLAIEPCHAKAMRTKCIAVFQGALFIGEVDTRSLHIYIDTGNPPITEDEAERLETVWLSKPEDRQIKRVHQLLVFV